MDTNLSRRGKRNSGGLQSLAGVLPARIADFYPAARSLVRKLVLVVGPTNSGKTHRALERLKRAESGVYLGPLRLLALEVRDRLEADGFPTSLITGELREIRENPRAAFTASTIEMTDFDAHVDIAIIDEVQMLGDAERGWAWVQAILGVPAREVWMLGSPEAQDAVQTLAQYLGEPLETISTERLTELEIDARPTRFADIAPQSVLVAFSRREVLDLAAEASSQHNRDCAVIYGALSPEVRTAQAERFRRGDVDLVVATDAIGMGLNLPVKHVLFTSLTKWDGKAETALPRELVWQIAGRAGRYGQHARGHVGALDRRTLEFIRTALEARPAAVPRFYRQGPTWPIVSAIAAALRSECLEQILESFLRRAKLPDNQYFSAALGEDQIGIARILDCVHGLPLKTRLALSVAPVPMLARKQLPREFLLFANAIANGERLRLDVLRYHLPPAAGAEQQRAEFAVRLLNLYCWLHYRWPDVFPDLPRAQGAIRTLDAAINRHLAKKRVRRCESCRRPLSRFEPFRYCDECFHAC